MKLATSLFVMALIAVGALLFLGGPLIDRQALHLAYALVKRQVRNDAVRRAGWAPSSQHGDFRGNERAAESVTRQKWSLAARTYHLCSLRSLERKLEFSHHPLCDKRKGPVALAAFGGESPSAEHGLVAEHV